MAELTPCKSCGHMPMKTIEVRHGRPVISYHCSCGRASKAYPMFPKPGSKEIPEMTRANMKSAEERALIAWTIANK